jgi:hypothetical protein
MKAASQAVFMPSVRDDDPATSTPAEPTASVSATTSEHL